jgi:deoxyribonuclease-4
LTHALRTGDGIGAAGVVLHPGAQKGEPLGPSMKRAAKVIAAALKDSESCPLLLEQTAGHKGLLGRDFDQTAELIALAGGGERLGLCLDSCHLFVQGYDVTDPDSLAKIVDEADAKVGLERLRCLHVNDAAAPLGSCRDRHANLGKGEMGKSGLAAFLSEPRFEGLPATLETPGPNKKGADRKEVMAAKRLRKAGLKRRNK